MRKEVTIAMPRPNVWFVIPAKAGIQKPQHMAKLILLQPLNTLLNLIQGIVIASEAEQSI